MPARKKKPAFVEHPEPEFPNKKARDAYREAKKRIREAFDTEETDLLLQDENLTQLPPEIGQLMTLCGFTLYHSQVTALPPDFGRLTALKHVSIAGTRLAELPPEIGGL